MCLDRALFIWNMLMESTPKRSRRGSSQIIFLLSFGSCKFFSLIYVHICFTTWKQNSEHVMLHRKVVSSITRLRNHKLNVTSPQLYRCTSVLAISDAPMNFWSCGERLHILLKPPPRFFSSLGIFFDLRVLRKSNLVKVDSDPKSFSP